MKCGWSRAAAVTAGRGPAGDNRRRVPRCASARRSFPVSCKSSWAPRLCTRGAVCAFSSMLACCESGGPWWSFRSRKSTWFGCRNNRTCPVLCVGVFVVRAAEVGAFPRLSPVHKETVVAATASSHWRRCYSRTPPSPQRLALLARITVAGHVGE